MLGYDLQDMCTIILKSFAEGVPSQSTPSQNSFISFTLNITKMDEHVGVQDNSHTTSSWEENLFDSPVMKPFHSLPNVTHIRQMQINT